MSSRTQSAADKTRRENEGRDKVKKYQARAESFADRQMLENPGFGVYFGDGGGCAGLV